MLRRFRRAAIYAVGWAFIVLGVLGIFLPILQGILFLLVGFWILSAESPWAMRQVKRVRERYPRLADKLDEAKEIAARHLRRLAEIFRNDRNERP